MVNIHIKSTNFNMTSDVEAYIESKITSIERFLQVTDDEQVLVEFEVEKSTHHKKGDVFRAEANLTSKGVLYRAEAFKFDVKVAVDTVRDQLEKQIRRSKSKRFELFEKGSRIIKNMLRKNNV